MRVLWFAVTPSLYDEQKVGGWIASLERIMRQYLPDTPLGIAFEHTDTCFKKESDNATYYPMNSQLSRKDRFLAKFDFGYSWQKLKPKVLDVVADFQPDVIHCFGSEWPFASIAPEVSVPVIIHMQGFLNVYNMSGIMSFSDMDALKCRKFDPLQLYRNAKTIKKRRYDDAFEQSIMQSNRYFMGRTQWDRNLIRYYSKDARYYHCPEAIRREIYDSSALWSFRQQKTMQLITVSQANVLKGNEIILRTAELLKNIFHFDFTWKVAGSRESFRMFEIKTGIRAEDVNIQLMGFVDADTIAKELSQAQAYIHPAIIDNSPNSLCEAQLIGCPVIAANVGGIPQLVDDGVTGILYPYNEPHTLAFHIMDLHNDQSTLEALSVEERRASRERHDPEKIAVAVKQIYSSVIEDYCANPE